jgi:hypothetical protein
MLFPQKRSVTACRAGWSHCAYLGHARALAASRQRSHAVDEDLV